ncbi:hypothetical protein Q7P37_006028 [Cladosporium fusiforme]
MALSHRGFLGGKIGGKALQIGVCTTASSGFLLFGYDQGVMSGIITEPSFLQQFPQMEPLNKSGAIQALVVAIYEIGCLIGSLFFVAYGDNLGRRRAVLIGTLIMLVGAAIQTSSFSLAQLIVGRIVTGAGNGMNTSSIPVWQSEIAPPKIRGYWINYGFWFVTQYGSFQWRFPIAFQTVFGILLIFGILLFPESPRWLLKHGKTEAAAEIMAHLHDTQPNDENICNDIDEINKLNAVTQGQKLTMREFLSKNRAMNRWRASVACACQAMQQIGGINLVTYYATTVFEKSLQFDPALSRFLTGWLGTEYFAAALVALFVVDRLGRRRLMMWGAAGMAVCLAVIGSCLAYAENGNKTPAYAATAFIFLYNSFFALGWLGVTWLYPAEVTPVRIRAEANGFSTSSNWLFNYAVVQLAPIMINKIAWKTYFVFFCFNAAFVPIVFWFFPETNGYKLEKLDAIFAEAYDKGENPVWTERRVRKEGASLDVEREVGRGSGDDGDGEKKDSIGNTDEKREERETV